jgi:hypothetical protein
MYKKCTRPRAVLCGASQGVAARRLCPIPGSFGRPRCPVCQEPNAAEWNVRTLAGRARGADGPINCNEVAEAISCVAHVQPRGSATDPAEVARGERSSHSTRRSSMRSSQAGPGCLGARARSFSSGTCHSRPVAPQRLVIESRCPKRSPHSSRKPHPCAPGDTSRRGSNRDDTQNGTSSSEYGGAPSKSCVPDEPPPSPPPPVARASSASMAASKTRSLSCQRDLEGSSSERRLPLM